MEVLLTWTAATHPLFTHSPVIHSFGWTLTWSSPSATMTINPGGHHLATQPTPWVIAGHACPQLNSDNPTESPA